MSLVPRTITGRLVFYIGLTNCVVLAATVWFSYARSRQILVQQIDSAARQEVETAVARLDDFLSKAAVRADLLASRQLELSQNPALNPDNTQPTTEPADSRFDPGLFPLLAQMLKDAPEDEAYGIWITSVMEGWDSKNNPTPLMAVHRHTLPNPTSFTNDYLAKVPDEEWYSVAKKTGQPYVTEPYYDDGGGNISMVSLTRPCFDAQGRFIGVSGVDVSLDRIRRLVSDLRCEGEHEQGEDEFSFLVSRGGRVITHPDIAKMLGKGNPGAEIKDLPEGTTVADQPSGMKLVYLNGQPRRLYWDIVPTSGWKVVFNVPNSVVSGPVHNLAFQAGLLGLGGLAVSLLVLTLIARNISRPLVRLTEIAQTVADGNLYGARQELDKFAGPSADSVKKNTATQADETGRLLHAIRTMMGNLCALLGQVQRSSVQIMSSTTQIAAAAKQQETTVNTFGGSTSQIAASVKEISATSQELLGTMNTVSEVAVQTADVAASGRTLLQSRQETLNQLIEATGSISGKLSVISQRAGDINLVVTTINKVADQTNLLSINAAIEAEKAGEYGLGFLVVAREIRRLADQTAVATLDIERMVREMQTSVSSGVMEMDKFSQEVRRAVEEMGGLTGQLNQIIQQVQALTARFEEVNEGMRSQSQGAGQISEAMIHLNDAARQTAASLGEFNKVTQHLSDAVVGLKDQVLRFKIEG